MLLLCNNRLKEELEWRDSGHGDDVDVTADEIDAGMISADSQSQSHTQSQSQSMKNWTCSTPRLLIIRAIFFVDKYSKFFKILKH